MLRSVYVSTGNGVGSMLVRGQVSSVIEVQYLDRTVEDARRQDSRSKRHRGQRLGRHGSSGGELCVNAAKAPSLIGLHRSWILHRGAGCRRLFE